MTTLALAAKPRILESNQGDLFMYAQFDVTIPHKTAILGKVIPSQAAEHRVETLFNVPDSISELALTRVDDKNGKRTRWGLTCLGSSHVWPDLFSSTAHYVSADGLSRFEVLYELLTRCQRHVCGKIVSHTGSTLAERVWFSLSRRRSNLTLVHTETTWRSPAKKSITLSKWALLCGGKLILQSG